jgi:hypothetical protein
VRFFFSDPFVLGEQILATFPQSQSQSDADAILKGGFRLFGAEPVRLGFAPDWLGYPQDIGERIAAEDEHWSDFDEGDTEDIRIIWELSRFSWVYPLVKAYATTQDSKYAKAFWDLLHSWMQSNPPNTGPNWASAQEVSLRLLALITAWFSFRPWFQDQQLEELLRAIAIHAERIPPTIVYAAAQRNNHLISESAALYSAGLLFPMLKSARRWKRLGRRRFLAALHDQIFPDGGYAQYSTNYHRMVLALSVWVAQLARLNGEQLPGAILAKLARSTDFLAESVDATSGGSSMLGHNDGTLLFPFSSDPFSDLRPTLQAAAWAFKRKYLYESGPWDELSMWFGLCESSIPPSTGTVAEKSKERSTNGSAGLHFLRAPNAWAAVRCVRFWTRPAHSDQLHLDLWWRGINVVKDPGTYRYRAEPPWSNGLSSALVHNAPVIDSQEPMRRLGPFLWADWSRGTKIGSRGRSPSGQELLLVEHDGYRSMGITIRRSVHRVGENLWLVVDDLLGSGTHKAYIAWTLPDLDYQLTDNTLALQSREGAIKLAIEGGSFSLIRAGEPIVPGEVPGYAPLLGWYSPTYGVKEPALCALVSAEARLPYRVVTSWRFGDAARDDLRIQWNAPGTSKFPYSALEHGEECYQVF